MAKAKRYDDTRAWYAIHTYSGYEEQVADNIRQRINGVDMSDKIFDVLVPKEKMIVIKNGKRKVIEQKIFQGYVLVEMKLSEDAWFIIRNTPGVTGFVGSGTKPIPLTDAEVKRILKSMGIDELKSKFDIEVSQAVRINSGAFENWTATVTEIYPERSKIKVVVNMFGRETPVEVDFTQVEKI